MTSITEHERAKYAGAWGIAAYSENSPGANHAPMFQRIAEPKEAQTVLDIGAGEGGGSRALAAMGLKVSAFDLVSTAWNNPGFELYTGTVWRDLPAQPFDYGYCCDVMEHIPTQFVALSIAEMLLVCEKVFFSVSFRRDVHGDELRDRLHLTIEPFAWWRDTFREIGTLLEARDLIGEGVFYLGR